MCIGGPSLRAEGTFSDKHNLLGNLIPVVCFRWKDVAAQTPYESQGLSLSSGEATCECQHGGARGFTTSSVRDIPTTLT